jgi:hypothetical protein
MHLTLYHARTHTLSLATNPLKYTPTRGAKRPLAPKFQQRASAGARVCAKSFPPKHKALRPTGPSSRGLAVWILFWSKGTHTHR